MNYEPPSTLTVGQLNRLAKQLLEDCFTDVSVSGELSTLSRPSSGHWYFTLKDDKAQIRCACFRNRNMRFTFRPEAGQQVTVRGKVSLYEGRGDYQLIVEDMQPAGAGALAAAFERLKQELKAEGWFDAERKKPLPESIHHIAVVTSATGAALEDVKSVLQRRWPAMRLSVLPVLVQGQQAAEQIASAIEAANRWHRDGQQHFDVLLLTRGGGSLEDLWPFNERRVAEAIFQSTLPVISAVGHEVDFSISDFVADIRAATPSAAAELLSPDQQDVLSRLHLLRARLASGQTRRLRQCLEQILALRNRLKDPRSHLREQSQRLDELELRLRQQWRQSLARRRQAIISLERQISLLSPQRQWGQRQRDVKALRARLIQAGKQQLRVHRSGLQALQNQLQSLGPSQTLQRGYAIVRNVDGGVIRDNRQLHSQQHLHVRFARGEASVQVLDPDSESAQKENGNTPIL